MLLIPFSERTFLRPVWPLLGSIPNNNVVRWQFQHAKWPELFGEFKDDLNITVNKVTSTILQGMNRYILKRVIKVDLVDSKWLIMNSMTKFNDE